MVFLSQPRCTFLVYRRIFLCLLAPASNLSRPYWTPQAQEGMPIATRVCVCVLREGRSQRVGNDRNEASADTCGDGVFSVLATGGLLLRDLQRPLEPHRRDSLGAPARHLPCRLFTFHQTPCTMAKDEQLSNCKRFMYPGPKMTRQPDTIPDRMPSRMG